MQVPLPRLTAGLGDARARTLLVICGLLVGLAVAAGTVLVLLELRQAAIEDSGRELENLSLMLAEETERDLQAVEVMQEGLAAHLRALGIDSADDLRLRAGSFDLHQDLVRRITELPYISALSVSEPGGEMMNFTRAWPPPKINDATRDFISALKQPQPPALFISAPSVSKTSGKWTIYLSRRFENSAGELIGFVVSTIETGAFERLFAHIALSPDSSFALYRTDGVLLARTPHLDPKIGKTFANTANFARDMASRDHAILRQRSVLDDRDRLMAPHSVAAYPLVIVVTDSMDAILASWHEQVRIIGGGTVLLELVIGCMVWLGARALRGQAVLAAAKAARAHAEVELALAEERIQGARSLQIQGQRFDAALNNMLQGLLMFDGAGQLLVVNRRFSELFGVRLGALAPGMSYDAMTDCIVAAGQITAEEMQRIRTYRLELINRGERAIATWEILGGRAFAVSHQPLEEGWLTTFEEITERRRSEARIAHLARHDALTDLPNRVLFHERLERALSHARRGHSLALLCLDLDQFKAVNDTLGHPVGDSLLQEVARRLQDGLRETDTVARLGGDEFAIVQTTIDSPVDATGLAERLIKLVEAPFDIAGHRIVIGTSVGIAFAPQDGLDANQLLKCADLALYRAKVDGRGIYRLFQAEMDAAMQARRILELDLRQALPDGQLEVFYQPLIDVRTRRLAGCEALLRWRHPTKGLIRPDQFIPLAEETGLIVPIGEWVLQQACAAAAGWPGDLKVAVNLSVVQFKNRHLVAAVTAALQTSGLRSDRLELEITETVMMQDSDTTLTTLHELRELGIRVAMDDFGTGYSSLSYLRLFPFDRIKIDQSFVRELGRQQDCSAIVRAVATLGVDLGMEITAEGVETRQQFDALERVGCTEVQGYLFSPAVPGSMVFDLLRRMSDVSGDAAVPALLPLADRTEAAGNQRMASPVPAE